jgi:hypothetical protein
LQIREIGAGTVAEVLEPLLSKCKALSSNPSTPKKKKKKEIKATLKFCTWIQKKDNNIVKN